MRIAHLLVAAMLVAITTIAINLYTVVRDKGGHERDARARHARETSRRALEALLDAETGQRGYTLTSDAEYLEPYERGRNAVRHELRTLAALVADEPRQRARVESLQVVVESKLAELTHTVELLKTGRRDEAMRVIASDVGKHTMDEARQIFAEIDRAAAPASRPTVAGIALAPVASLVGSALVLALVTFALRLDRTSRRA